MDAVEINTSGPPQGEDASLSAKAMSFANVKVIDPLEEEQPVEQIQRSLKLKRDHRFDFSYDDEITPEEELINTIKSNDSEEEKKTKVENLFEKNLELNVNFQNINKDASLHIAVRKGERIVVELLIEKGAKISGNDIKNKFNRTPLDIARKPDTPNGQEIVNILERHLKSPSKPSSQVETLSKQQKEVKDNKRKRDQSLSDPNKRQKPDQNNSSQFVEKTLNQQDYQVWLTQEDIANIASIKYGWYGEDDNVIFEVIGSVEQLNAQLTRYKERIKVPGKQSLTFIINLNSNHWVTLVITHHNQQFFAYYINSFGGEITSDIQDKLNSAMPEIKIRNPKFRRQEDEYNCGIFALENAKIINNGIQSGQINQIEQELIGYKPTSGDLENKRKKFAEALQQQESIRIEENKPEDSNQVKPRISSPDHQPMEVDVEPEPGPSQQSSDRQENGESRKRVGLLTSYHGVVYQVQWMMTVALESKKHGAVSGFTFKTEVEDKDAGKFDDVVWQYKDDQQKYRYNFLQAKHKLDADQRITIEDLLKSKQKDPLKSDKSDKRPFALEKYFISYRDKIKTNPKYQNEKNGDQVGDLIIVTNIDLDEKLKKSFAKSGFTKIPVLEGKSNSDKNKKSEYWKIKGNSTDKEEIKQMLEGTYDLIKLAKRLEKCVLNNQPLSINDFLNPYSKVLEQIQPNLFKFRDNFINGQGLSEQINNLREAFFQEAFTNPRKSLNTDYKINDPEALAKKIALKCSEAKNSQFNVKIYRGGKVIGDNIDRLAGYVLIEKNGNIQFNPKFWTASDNELPNKSKSLKVFRNTLEKSKLTVDKLNKFKFKITNFKTCKEILIDENSFWEGVKNCQFVSSTTVIPLSKDLPNHSLNDIKKDIEDFFNKLVFAVNYFKESLSKIVERELGENFGLIDSDYIARVFRVEIAKALDLTEEKFISTAEDVSQFFDKARQQIDRLILIGPTLEYRATIKEFGINFEQDAVNELKLGDFLTCQPNKQILNVIAERNELSSIKVDQILKSISEYQKDDSHIFMRLSSLLRIQNRVLQAFNSESNNLLVIECNTTYIGIRAEAAKNDVENLYKNLKDIIKNKSSKKIVLITKQGDALANKFKDDFSDRYEKKNDKRNSLIDLIYDSQKKLLKKGKVKFQEKEISLGTLIDEESKHLIDAEVLSKLINNEEIEIGKAPTNFKYDDVEDYYIDRIFTRHIKIKKGFEKEKSKFCVIDKSQVTKPTLRPNQDIVLISDIEKDFTDLRNEDKERNIHWLKKDGKEFIWQQSHGALSILREIVDTNEQSIQEYEPKKITDIPDRVVIIAAEPGMGKSTVLTLLAKESDPSLWVVRINLLDQTNRLYEWQEDKTEINELQVVKFLYGAMDFRMVFRENGEQTEEKKEQMINNILKPVPIENNGEIALKNNEERKIKGLNLLEVMLFYNFYEQGKIALLFDGFDEISPDYKDQVIKLLEVLKGTKAEKIWMTTRPYNIQSEPENKLGTFSYALKPFLEKEQRGFLKKFWKKNLELSELDEQRSEVFVDELLHRFSESTNDQEREFVGIPLQINMIAEVFSDEFKEFYYFDNQELSEENKQALSKKLNLVTLYEAFLDIKLDKELKKENPDLDRDRHKPQTKRDIEEKRKRFVESHKKLAVYTMFEEYNLEKLLSKQEIEEVHALIDKIKEGKEKTGIIVRIINGKPNFTHRTFAEYLAANYLWEKFKSIQFDKFEEDFIKSIIINNLIKDDRIQICKFFQLKTQKDLENNVDFSDKKDKLETLLIKLVDKIYRYGPYEDENSKQSTKLLLKIIEFFLSAKEGSDLGIIRNVQNLGSHEKLALLSVSAEMGYIKLATALGKNLNTEFLQQNLKGDKWFYNPVWLAAKNCHLDILDLLNKIYDLNWVDKDRKTLLQRAFQKSEFNVIKSCLRSDIIDGKPYENLNYNKELPIIGALNAHAPSDVIKLLIEKTDIDLFNKFEDCDKFVYSMSINLLKYDKEITELAIKKGIDFTRVINVLLFEFNCESLNSPIDQLKLAHYIKSSFHSDEEFLNLFNRIELLLKGGAGYNCKGQYQITTLQYAERIYYIHKLLDRVHKLHNQKNDKSSSPLGTILKLIIDSMSIYVRGYEIIIDSTQISLLPNYKHKSFLLFFLDEDYDEEIYLLSSKMTKLLFESYKDSNTNLIKDTLDELRSYISNAKEEIEQFKKYPDSKTYNDIFISYEDMFKFWKFTNIEQKKRQYESLNEFVKDLLDRVLKLYIRQDYEIDDALEEVSEEVSKFEKVINRLLEIKNLNREKNVYETGEILDILDIKSIDTNKELQDLISKIYKCGGIQLVRQTWSNLNYIGQKRIMGILELMFKFSDQSSKTFELLKKLDSSYHDLTNAFRNKKYQEIKYILQNAEPDFINAIINGHDDKYGSPLHYAACIGEIETTRILLTHGANPNRRLKEGDLLLSTANSAEETEDDEDWSPKDYEENYEDLKPLLHSAALCGQLEDVKNLLIKDADVNAKTYEGRTPLHLAALNGQLEVVKILLINDADVNAKTTYEDQTPLHLAALNGQLEVVKILLSKGADVNAKPTYEGQTPLHLAALNGQLEVVEILLIEGADVNAETTYEGQTPLHLAALNGQLEVVKILLIKGADVNAKATYEGQTPLHASALSYGHLKTAQLLLEKGAHYDIKNTQGKTPLDLAKSGSKVKNLLDCIDQLFQAVRDNKKDVVNSLLEGKDSATLKAIFGTRNSDEKTLLQVASANKQTDIVKLLIGGEVSAEECLPSTNHNRKKREAAGECLFSWEDVDDFNEEREKDEKRDFSVRLK